jgi:hypothetical protein
MIIAPLEVYLILSRRNYVYSRILSTIISTLKFNNFLLRFNWYFNIIHTFNQYLGSNQSPDLGFTVTSIFLRVRDIFYF